MILEIISSDVNRRSLSSGIPRSEGRMDFSGISFCAKLNCHNIALPGHSLCTRCVPCLDRSRGLWLTKDCSVCNTLILEHLTKNDFRAKAILNQIWVAHNHYCKTVARKSLHIDDPRLTTLFTSPPSQSSSRSKRLRSSSPAAAGP